jgi:hypothetical protein
MERSTAWRGRASAIISTISVATIAASALMATAAIRNTARAEDAEIASRRAAERKNFTDDQIKDGFFKIAFGAELQFDRRDERIRKFDEPVRVSVINRGRPNRRATIAAVVADIRAHVNGLDLAMADDADHANFVVTLVRHRDFARTVRSYYGADKAKQIQRSLRPQCLSGIGKDRNDRITRAEAILPVDADDFAFYDCAYEELLQGLGVINDDSSVPWTMFNDDVQMGFFDLYDQYLVNILYDPRIRPGMTKSEVSDVLPEVLPAVRAWVAKANTRNGIPISKQFASAAAGSMFRSEELKQTKRRPGAHRSIRRS